jgi:putative SOS response-associated peptidase YedK
VAQALLHREHHVGIAARLDIDHAVGVQPGEVERGREQVTPSQAPEDWPVDPGENARQEDRGAGIVREIRTSRHFMQRTGGQAAPWKPLVDRFDAERHDRVTHARALDLRDLRPQTLKDDRLAHGIQETRKLSKRSALFGPPERVSQQLLFAICSVPGLGRTRVGNGRIAMSRLHSIQASIGEIAQHLGVEPVPELEIPGEIVEGLHGLVVMARHGRRLLKSMTWGFPRHTLEGRLRGDTPQRLGLVATLTNPMWDKIATDPRYRCLIVLTHFGNPDGEAGSKTRTWFSVKGQPIMAWAGFCRNTPEFGPVYAGMTMAANAAIPPTNDRMPVLLDGHEYDLWLHGSVRDVIRFQHREPFAADRMIVERNGDRWRSGAAPSRLATQLAVL